MQLMQHNHECKSLADGFDYSIIDDADTAAALKEATGKIRACYRQATSSIIEIGKHLITVQDRLGHGLFGQWLKAEFDWTDRTARNYVRAAEVFGSKSEIVSDLAPTTLYLLSSRSTPEMIVADAVAKLESGERLDHPQLMADIQKARAEIREARSEAKLTRRQRKRKAEERHRHQQHVEEVNRKFARMDEAQARAIAILIEYLDPEVLKEYIACCRVCGVCIDKLERAAAERVGVTP